jgi:hypothetical protein
VLCQSKKPAWKSLKYGENNKNKGPIKNRTKVQNPLKRMAKLNMIRATLPVLLEAPNITKEEKRKFEEEEKKQTFGGAIMGKEKQSSEFPFR